MKKVSYVFLIVFINIVLFKLATTSHDINDNNSNNNTTEQTRHKYHSDFNSQISNGQVNVIAYSPLIEYEDESNSVCRYSININITNKGCNTVCITPNIFILLNKDTGEQIGRYIDAEKFTDYNTLAAYSSYTYTIQFDVDSSIDPQCFELYCSLTDSSWAMK